MDIWRFPPILLLHFKRFKYSGRSFHKIGKLIEFPMSSLPVEKYCVNDDVSNVTYDLFAVLVRSYMVVH